jgi:hypothetical protein
LLVGYFEKSPSGEDGEHHHLLWQTLRSVLTLYSRQSSWCRKVQERQRRRSGKRAEGVGGGGDNAQPSPSLIYTQLSALRLSSLTHVCRYS